METDCGKKPLMKCHEEIDGPEVRAMVKNFNYDMFKDHPGFGIKFPINKIKIYTGTGVEFDKEYNKAKKLF